MLVLVLGVVAAGCHKHAGISTGTTTSPTSTGQTGSGTTTTGSGLTPDGTNLDKLLQPWTAPPIDTRDWQLAYTTFEFGRVDYRVPFEWTVDRRGRASGVNGLVRTYVELTPISAEEISLAAYAAELAGDKPIYVLRQADGQEAFIVEKRVSLAPEDPDAPVYVFHTALLDLDGRIARLEVRYASENAYRFAGVSRAVVGTVQVQRPVVIDEE